MWEANPLRTPDGRTENRRNCRLLAPTEGHIVRTRNFSAGCSPRMCMTIPYPSDAEDRTR